VLLVILVGGRFLLCRHFSGLRDLQLLTRMDDIGILDLIAVALPDFRPHPCIVIDVLFLRDVPEAIPIMLPGPDSVDLDLSSDGGLEALHLIIQLGQAIVELGDHGKLIGPEALHRTREGIHLTTAGHQVRIRKL